MKKLSVLLVSLMASVTSFAGGYGVVDFPKVIENSTYIKQQEASLQQSVKADTTKLDQLRKEIVSLQQKAGDSKVKPDELKRLEQQFQTKMAEYTKTQQSVQMRLQQGMRQIETTLNQRVAQVTDQLRTENKLDIILERGAVISFDKKDDLTDKVIQRLNAIK